MNFLLSISPDQYGEKIIETAGIAETLGFGGQILLLGIGAVFSVLSVIWLVLTVFKIVFEKLETKEQSQPQKTESVIAQSSVSDDNEIIAAIAAAIAMAESESDSNIKFKVVSFRKK